MKTPIPQSLIVVLIVCFWSLQNAHAISPTPDGCNPNFTTAEGCDALNSLTTGAGNTGLGWRSLFSDTTGSFNTGVGGGTLVLNNTGDENTAVGAAALLLNTGGSQNTAVGTSALVSNDSGDNNTAVGFQALLSNTSSNFNTAIGNNALEFNTTGFENTALGNSALRSNTTGGQNTAIGENALEANTTGGGNVALGFDACSSVITANDVTCIGAFGADVSNTTWIGNVYGVTTQSGTTAPVVISDGGQLGTVASSERFKKDITAMDKASEVILSFRPVTFHYKTDTKDIPQFGLIAEEVAKVNPALVLPDKEGKPYTVRYDAVNAMLLNEFLKEHRTVQNQQNEIDALKAELREQKALIQKVSAQLELSKSAPQTVVNNQ
jgi:hypothetical protein